MAEFRLGRLKFNWRGDWQFTTAYVIDDIIKYGANTYVCKKNHTSADSETSFYAQDLTDNWTLHTEGLAQKGNWNGGQWYKINDVYKYGNTLYRVTAGHTSSGSFTEADTIAYATEYLQSFNYEDTWDPTTQYQDGDVVTYGGYTYVSKSVHVNKPPSYNLTNDWDIITTGFNVVGTWDNATDYKQGDLALYGGYSYVAITTSTNSTPATNTSNWSLVTKGVAWKGNWDSVVTYQLGDAVKRLSNSYIGVSTAGSTNQDPSTDSAGLYWSMLAEGAANNVMTTQGDLVYYTTGAARLPKGTNGQVLAMSSSGAPNWENNSVTHPVYYVTEEGSDLNDGSNISRAFHSVRHACAVAEGPASIYVKAGNYAEQLPIIVPETVSIVGDNLRTSKINPAKHYAHTFISAATDAVTPNVGSPVTPASGTTYDSTTGELVLDIGTHGLTTSNTITIGNATLIFTCDQDNHVTQHKYPRAKDPVYGKSIAITAVTGTTITVNVGKGNASRHQDITLASAPAATYTPSGISYNPSSGEMEVTIGDHDLSTYDSIKIVANSLTFTCDYNGDGQTTQKTYPRSTGANTTDGKDYAYDTALPITQITETTITVNVNGGQGAITDTSVHNFISGTAGAIQKAAPYVSYGSSIRNGAGTKWAVILDSDYSEKQIQIRNLSGGEWDTNDTWENGGTDIAITAVETRPNEHSTMFQLSNATMLKDILMEGLTGFTPAGTVATKTCSINGSIVTGTDLFPDLVGTNVTGAGVSTGTKVSGFISDTQIEVDKQQTLGATSLTFTANQYDPNNAHIKGTFVSLNPESRVIKSPYVSNCSAKSVKGVGAIVDGGVHRQFVDGSTTPSNKSIVFDSFTNIHDEGMAFWITDGAVAETVSCFTYYNHISYAATRGGRLRSLVGNSSWGKYGVVSSGFSPLEKAREGIIEGLKLTIDVETQVGSGFQVGERIRGNTSEAWGYIHTVQGTTLNNIYYSVISEGAVGVGTGFAPGETITAQTSGTTANLIDNPSANEGQSGRILVLSGLGTSPTLEENGSIEFITGSGNGGYNSDNITGADPFTFVISNVSQTGPIGKGNVSIDRGQWTTTGAAHTGGSTTFIKYPVQSGSCTLLTPAQSGDTTFSVSTISGFNPGEYALTPTNELLKIVSFPTANSMTVTRANDGAATASAYVIGETLTSIGATSFIGSAEVWKDFTSSDSSFRASISQRFEDSVGSYMKFDDEFMKVTGVTTDTYGTTQVTLVEEKPAKAFDEQDIKIRYIFSQARLTGHDFLQVGTGGTYTTNWPSAPTQDPVQTQEITEDFPGRVFYVSTDEQGNFRVGKYFRVNQATGAATLNANSFDLSGLTSIRLGSIGAQLGAQVNEFSTDGTMSQNSNEKVPTQAAVRTYVQTKDVEHLNIAQTTTTLGLATERSHTIAGITTALQTATTHLVAGIGTLRNESERNVQVSEFFIGNCQ